MTADRVAIEIVAATALTVVSTYSGQTSGRPSIAASTTAMAMSPKVLAQPTTELTISTLRRSNASASMPPQSPAMIIGTSANPPTSDTANVERVMS